MYDLTAAITSPTSVSSLLLLSLLAPLVACGNDDSTNRGSPTDASPAVGADPAAEERADRDAGPSFVANDGGPARADASLDGAVEPSDALPLCPGDVPAPVTRAPVNVAPNPWGDVVPSVIPLKLGDRFPLVPFKPPVARGEVVYTPSEASYSAAGTNVVTRKHLADTITVGMASLAPFTTRGSSGHAYVGLANGAPEPAAWATEAATPANALSFGTFFRADVGEVLLFNTFRTADWTPEAESYVASFRYTRYIGFAFHFLFPTECQRDRYVALAGGRTLDAMLPTGDASRLVEYLAASKTKFRLHVIALAPDRELLEIVKGSHCSTADLEACNELVTKLTEAAEALGRAPAPATFRDAYGANEGWYIDRVALSPSSSLREPTP
jgi:hypothetical protein